MTAPRYAPVYAPRLKAVPKVDDSARTAAAVLSFPCIDRDLDYVEPAGGDWSLEFPSNPVVDWWHGIPIGRGDTPVVKALSAESAARAGVPAESEVLTGTTTFFRSEGDAKGLRAVDGRTYSPAQCFEDSRQAFHLIQKGVASGTSLAFRPDDRFPDSAPLTGGTSPLSGRPSRHYRRYVGLGWAHAPDVVNPLAGVLEGGVVGKALPRRLVDSLRILETGRFEGEKLSRTILKAFGRFKPLLAGRKTPTAVVPAHPPRPPVEKAPMADSYDPDDDGDDDLTPEGDTDADAGTPADPTDDPAPDAPTGMTPTPMAALTLVQGVKDQLEQAKVALNAAEHPEGKARVLAAIQSMEDEADQLVADLQQMFPEAGLDAPDDAPEPEGEAPLPTTDDGALMTKAFPKGLPRRLRPVRFKAADLLPVKKTAPADQAVKVLKAANKDLTRRVRQLEREKAEYAEETRKLLLELPSRS